MKTIATGCLTIFQILFTFISFGQTYHPLIENNKFWDVMYSDGSFCGALKGFRYYFQGDTLMGGQQYHVLHAYSVVSTNTIVPFFCPPFAVDTNQKSIAGFIREDTIARKVYINYKKNNVNHDTLLYDFSITKGDTLKAYYSKNVIDSVGVTTLLNGESRKIFYIHGTAPNKSYYIEGVGGSMGIITPLYMPLGGQGELVCVTQNNVRLWGQGCFGLLTGINTISGNYFLTITPNPSQDFIRINRGKATPAIFYMYDFTGRLVVSEKLTSTFELIDIRQFVSGVYFYNCQYNESENVSGKIVVVR